MAPATRKLLTHPAALAGFAIALLSGCQQVQLPTQFAGTWVSEGYGYVLVAQGSSITHYDLAVDGKSGPQCVRATGDEAFLARLISASELRISDDGSRATLNRPNDPYPLYFKKIATLPEPCSTLTPDTVQGNFDAFTAFMATHYAFFELYGVDWESAVQQARSKLSQDMPDGALFDLFSEMLAPLNDAHVGLRGTVAGKERSFEPSTSAMGRMVRARASTTGESAQAIQQTLLKELWIDGVNQDVLDGNAKFAANNLIAYSTGKLPGKPAPIFGYLAIQRESGYANKDSVTGEADLRMLHTVMDQAIDLWEQAGVKGVVINLAINFGGSDYLSRAIAERFAAERTLAYSKRAVERGGEAPVSLYLEPYAGKRFTGPVVIITSNTTVSAGEILTMSLRALPNVTHIGEKTRGAFSDILDKTLPNGWALELSNEIYTDHTGRLWEGEGVAPERAIAVLDPAAPRESQANAVRMGFELLALEL